MVLLDFLIKKQEGWHDLTMGQKWRIRFMNAHRSIISENWNDFCERQERLSKLGGKLAATITFDHHAYEFWKTKEGSITELYLHLGFLEEDYKETLPPAK